MRIVAGRFKGRPIAAPETDEIRPTRDRVRQSLFNILEHGVADCSFADARVLDLFAGSGALGLEAMSRGAGFAMFVETGAAQRGAIRDNVTAFGLGGQTRILKRDATDLGLCQPTMPFNLVFLDPPYGKGLADRALAAVVAGGWLAPEAIVVCEEATSARVAWPAGLTLIDERRYGVTSIGFARADG